MQRGQRFSMGEEPLEYAGGSTISPPPPAAAALSRIESSKLAFTSLTNFQIVLSLSASRNHSSTAH